MNVVESVVAMIEKGSSESHQLDLKHVWVPENSREGHIHLEKIQKAHISRGEPSRSTLLQDEVSRTPLVVAVT